MYSLLVLGLVPGTDIQINFLDWLYGLAGLLLLGLLVRRRIVRRPNRLLLALLGRLAMDTEQLRERAR